MGTIWELDFYSRPILDENGKKLWEVAICESPMTTMRSPDSLFRYAKYCPSNTVNSVWLSEAITEAIAQAPNPPTKVRFFRRQMNNMITKACKDLGIDARLGRRTIALNHWLNDRMAQVYPQEPNYQESAITTATVRYQAQNPKRLPDAVQGQKWAFVNLDASAFADMADWEIGFEEGFPLELTGIDENAVIPGAIVFSPRSLPLAGWMSGLELGFLKFDDRSRPRLLLETGADESWILADLVGTQTQTEAKGFEEKKQSANGVHFLAVQSDPNAQSFAGFWLLQELNLG
ncbi:MAG: Tab2/Atab2 family RNA-binding protein [Geitlerinemataceae cyanobacterium]